MRLLLILDGKISGDILYLGYYESEFDWSNETLAVSSCFHSCFQTNITHILEMTDICCSE